MLREDADRLIESLLAPCTNTFPIYPPMASTRRSVNENSHRAILLLPRVVVVRHTIED